MKGGRRRRVQQSRLKLRSSALLCSLLSSKNPALLSRLDFHSFRICERASQARRKPCRSIASRPPPLLPHQNSKANQPTGDLESSLSLPGRELRIPRDAERKKEEEGRGKSQRVVLVSVFVRFAPTRPRKARPSSSRAHKASPVQLLPNLNNPHQAPTLDEQRNETKPNAKWNRTLTLPSPSSYTTPSSSRSNPSLPSPPSPSPSSSSPEPSPSSPRS